MPSYSPHEVTMIGPAFAADAATGYTALPLCVVPADAAQRVEVSLARRDVTTITPGSLRPSTFDGAPWTAGCPWRLRFTWGGTGTNGAGSGLTLSVPGGRAVVWTPGAASQGGAVSVAALLPTSLSSTNAKNGPTVPANTHVCECNGYITAFACEPVVTRRVGTTTVAAEVAEGSTVDIDVPPAARRMYVAPAVGISAIAWHSGGPVVTPASVGSTLDSAGLHVPAVARFARITTNRNAYVLISFEIEQ